MIKDFLLIGLGPRSVGYDEGIVDRILENQKGSLVLLAEKVVLTPQQKAVTLDFISDPEKMKEDYLHLLQWYEEHMHSSSPYDEKRLKESRENLQRNLSTFGNDHLLKLTDIMHNEELEEEGKMVLVLSYFIKNAQRGILHPRAKNDVFLIGYNYVSSLLEGDPVANASRRYGALSNSNRIRLLNSLFAERLTGYELSRKMKLSNAELTETFSALVACGLVKTVRESDRIIFTADREEVIDMLTGEIKGKK